MRIFTRLRSFLLLEHETKENWATERLVLNVEKVPYTFSTLNSFCLPFKFVNMGYKATKTEHVGAKKGQGSYWGKKKEAKKESNKRRRAISKLLSKLGFGKN